MADNQEQVTAETATEQSQHEPEILKTPTPDKNKPIKYSLPFGNPIFARPDREVKVERTNRKGEKTGVIGRLMADVIIPVNGNILSIKTSVWCDTKYSREDGGFVDVYSVSLPRNTFAVADVARGHYDDFRNMLLSKFDTWLESPAAKQRSSMVTTPRLVKVRKAEAPNGIEPSPDSFAPSPASK